MKCLKFLDSTFQPVVNQFRMSDFIQYRCLYCFTNTNKLAEGISELERMEARVNKKRVMKEEKSKALSQSITKLIKQHI